MLIWNCFNCFWIYLCLPYFFSLVLGYYSQIYCLTGLWNHLLWKMTFCFSFMWFTTHMIYTSLALMIERKPSYYRYCIIFLGKRDVMTAYQHTPRKQTNFYASLKVSNTVDLQALLINCQLALKLQSAVYIIDHHYCTHGNRLMIWRKWLPIVENNEWGKKKSLAVETHEVTIFWNKFILTNVYFFNKCLFKIWKEQDKFWEIMVCK